MRKKKNQHSLEEFVPNDTVNTNLNTKLQGTNQTSQLLKAGSGKDQIW